MIRFLLIFLASVSIDQGLKALALSSLKLYQMKSILKNLPFLPDLSFTRISNMGGIFGRLAPNEDGWQWLVTRLAPSLLLASVLGWFAWQHFVSKKINLRVLLRTKSAPFFALFLAGASSNLFDSYNSYRVVDTLTVLLFGRWYPFNVADLCIWIGCIGLLILNRKTFYKHPESALKSSYENA